MSSGDAETGGGVAVLERPQATQSEPPTPIRDFTAEVQKKPLAVEPQKISFKDFFIEQKPMARVALFPDRKPDKKDEVNKSETIKFLIDNVETVKDRISAAALEISYGELKKIEADMAKSPLPLEEIQRMEARGSIRKNFNQYTDIQRLVKELKSRGIDILNIADLPPTKSDKHYQGTEGQKQNNKITWIDKYLREHPEATLMVVAPDPELAMIKQGDSYVEAPPEMVEARDPRLEQRTISGELASRLQGGDVYLVSTKEQAEELPPGLEELEEAA